MLLSKKQSQELQYIPFQGKLIVSIGEGTAFYNIDMTKASVTVSGSTTYNNVGKENITIYFSKDSQLSIIQQ